MMRTMTRRNATGASVSLLESALLALLHDKPCSGYALRKVFQDTPMFHFSDSPGSIYPALRRMEARGLLRGTVEGARTLRPRQVFRLTREGTAALHAWLTAPVTRDTVVRGLEGAMLRFAFIDRVVGPAATAAFLASLARELAAHLADLEQFHSTQARALPLTGRLALEHGIDAYRTQLAWARRAARRFKAPGQSTEGGHP